MPHKVGNFFYYLKYIYYLKYGKLFAYTIVEKKQ